MKVLEFVPPILGHKSKHFRFIKLACLGVMTILFVMQRTFMPENRPAAVSATHEPRRVRRAKTCDEPSRRGAPGQDSATGLTVSVRRLHYLSHAASLRSLLIRPLRVDGGATCTPSSFDAIAHEIESNPRRASPIGDERNCKKCK